MYSLVYLTRLVRGSRFFTHLQLCTILWDTEDLTRDDTIPGCERLDELMCRRIHHPRLSEGVR